MKCLPRFAVEAVLHFAWANEPVVLVNELRLVLKNMDAELGLVPGLLPKEPRNLVVVYEKALEAMTEPLIPLTK